MATSLRDLRRKIKSIQGTKKLTQAMQMVAASKMQKAIQRAQMTRDYSRLAWEIIKNVGAKTEIAQHPLLQKREDKTIALILITSNRGLCGGLNAQIIRKISSYIREKKEKGIKTEIITMGNKGKNYISHYYKEMLVADFPTPDRLVEFSDITPLAKIALDDYIAGKYDRVCIFYNHFISTLRQTAIRRQLLPIPDLTEVEEYQLAKGEQTGIQTPASPASSADRSADGQKPKTNFIEYKYEPDPKSVLDILLPRIIQTQLYQILLEASASEHSARMVAMKNATDNAEDLIGDLQLTYNSLRQATITKEITEIAAGAEALRI